MDNLLIQYFSKFAALSQEEINIINDSMVVRNFEKNSYILKEGQRSNDTFFIMKGLIREYRIVNNEEISTNFYTEGQWFIFLADFTDDDVSGEYLICIEDTTVVVGDENKAQELFKMSPGFETISRAVMENVFAEQQKMMRTYLINTPEERYLNLINVHPDLFQRVSQYHLASYIGVKPESLSRIRKRVYLKERQLFNGDAGGKSLND